MSCIQKTFLKGSYADSSLLTQASPSALTWDCSLLPWLSDHWSKSPFSRWQRPLLYIRHDISLLFSLHPGCTESQEAQMSFSTRNVGPVGLSPLLLLWHNAKLIFTRDSASREVKGGWPIYLDNQSPLLLWGHFGAEGGHEYSQIF